MYGGSVYKGGQGATWSGLSRGGEEGRDKRVRSQREKNVLQEERGLPHPDWQSAMLSGGEPAQDNTNKEWVS